jgi:hypothetical protein
LQAVQPLQYICPSSHSQSPTSIATADAKFGINIDDAAMSSTSSFFFMFVLSDDFDEIPKRYSQSLTRRLMKIKPKGKEWLR